MAGSPDCFFDLPLWASVILMLGLFLFNETKILKHAHDANRPFLLLTTELVFSLFVANDNDMTMDEGMSFTIGELPFTIFTTLDDISVLSMGLILSVDL